MVCNIVIIMQMIYEFNGCDLPVLILVDEIILIISYRL